MQLLQRVTRTFDQNKVTELGAIYLSLVVFLILLWRVGDESVKISQFIVTRGLQEPEEPGATGYDYWYEVTYAGIPPDPNTGLPPKKVGEYIEITGTRAGDIKTKIKEKMDRFLDDQGKVIEKFKESTEIKGLQTQSEVTVIGIDYGQPKGQKSNKSNPKEALGTSVKTTVHLEYAVEKYKSIQKLIKAIRNEKKPNPRKN